MRMGWEDRDEKKIGMWEWEMRMRNEKKIEMRRR